MNRELQEKIQAWVDGELDASEARRIADLTQSDPSALALANNLRGFRDLVRQHPPERAVDASRDFYWSRIRQGIERAETIRPARTTPKTAPNPARWLAWFIPSAVVALAAVFVLRPESNPVPARESQAPVLVEHVVESPLEEMNTLTFYSSNDAMTVVWVGPADIL
jgi:anti-sigma factor RsiW